MDLAFTWLTFPVERQYSRWCHPESKGSENQPIQSFCHHELFPFPGEAADGQPDHPPAQMNKAMALIPDESELGDLFPAMLLHNGVPKELSDTTRSSKMGRSAGLIHIDIQISA